MKVNAIRKYLDCITTEVKGQPSLWEEKELRRFIECVLGIDINVAQKTIVWYLHWTEQHGVQDLKIGDFCVDLISDERASANAPFHLTVSSGGEFTLQTVVGDAVTQHRIQKGTVTICVG